MKTKGSILMGMLLCIVWLSGCWNSRDLGDLAIVMGMGIDRIPETKEYRVSFQIVNPGEVAAGGKGGGGIPVTVYSETGSTFFEAIRKTAQKAPRQLFFGHMSVIVVGETLARESIQDLFDFFERSNEVRMTSIVLVARESTAESVISILTPMEKIPSNSLIGKTRFADKVLSENIEYKLDEVIRSFVSEGGVSTISGVKIVGNPQEGMKTSNKEQSKVPTYTQIDGMALFREGKPIRWLDGSEARGTVWIQNKMKSTIVNLDCQEKKEALAIEIIRSVTKVKAEIRNGKPAFSIRIWDEGTIGEVKCGIDLSKPEELEKLIKELEEETKKEVTAAIKVAQDEKRDIFGLGGTLARKYPKTWENLKEEWNETFSESQVDVFVESYIRRPGARMRPYLLETK
ncbi:Ger(x)C family spore germination protein [Gracilibacillus dipsosauri]|uniref:Ger(x)C family spore germination protein n=1 Tax=Gracilibacillus dipsosauri TaxID=178340 RepID=UPI0024093AD2